MYLLYILIGIALIMLLSLIPLPKQKLRNTINKYVYEKDSRNDLMTKVENSFLIRMITPKKESMKYEKEFKNLKRSGVSLNPEKVSIIKIFIFVVSFFFILGVFINLNTLREKGILSQLDSTNNAATLIFGDIAAPQENGTTIYNSLLAKTLEETPDYKKYFKNNRMQDLAVKIASIRENMNIQDPKDEVARKVLNTLLQGYNLSTISAGNIALILLLAMLSTGIIDLIFYFKKLFRNRKIEKEFAKIEAVTILLMNRDNVNVVSLLQQMKSQSKLLRPYLQQCLNQYTSNPVQALDNLVEEVNNIEFSKFITIIKQCLYSDKGINNQILKIQRNLRLAMQETINKQRNSGKRIRLTIMQFPLLLLLILLLMMPFFDIIKNTI